MSVMVRLGRGPRRLARRPASAGPTTSPPWARTSTPCCAGWPTGRSAEGDVVALKHTTRWVRAQVRHVHYGLDVNTLHRDDSVSTLKLNDVGPGQPAGDPAALLRQLPPQPLHRVVRRGRRRHQRHGGRRHDPRGRLTDGPGLGPRVVGGSLTAVATVGTPSGPGAPPSGSPDCRGRGSRPWPPRSRSVWWRAGDPPTGSTATTSAAASTCDLGFSPEGREENVRRVAEVALLFADAGLIALAALISPYAKGRRRARALHEDGRDPRSSRSTSPPRSRCAPSATPRASTPGPRSGEITSFTGVDHPYEPPEDPDLVVGHHLPLSDAVDRVLEALGAAELGASTPSVSRITT